MVFWKCSYQNRQNWCARASRNGFSFILAFVHLNCLCYDNMQFYARNNDIMQFFAQFLRSKAQSFFETRCFNNSNDKNIQEYRFDDSNSTISWFSLLKLMGLNKLENIIHTNKWLSYNDIYRLVV